MQIYPFAFSTCMKLKGNYDSVARMITRKSGEKSVEAGYMLTSCREFSEGLFIYTADDGDTC